MNVLRRLTWQGLTAIGGMALTACASRPAQVLSSNEFFRSGRLSLQIASTPPQSLSAGFELKSQQQSGELKLFNPFGSQLAILQWEPGLARLEQGGQIWQNKSLDALMIQLTGTNLPVISLIDWLQSRPTESPGWVADLSRIQEGRLSVQNTPTSTQPTVSLRLILEP
jgi:outer membrane lipoprotein LolB